MEITGYTWEKCCGSFRFMMESWIFKSNIEWKLLVWNVVLPMERFIHIHLDLADNKVIKTNDKHALLKPSVPIHSTLRPVKRNKQVKFWDCLILNTEIFERSFENQSTTEFTQTVKVYLNIIHLNLHLLHLAHLIPFAFSTHLGSQEKVYFHQLKKLDLIHLIHLFKWTKNTIHMQECQLQVFVNFYLFHF